ncbi:MAG: hypothetical protein GTN99_03320 [Candidatus Dadabacteria bacterium]|nr:hypothetical protein [Candidatus Dadabacteria bacterium]NIT13291.1 hypothetical protein [Candidatus Dadabacteria bacterium]
MAIFTKKFDILLPKSIKSELNFIEKGIVSYYIQSELFFIIKNNGDETLNHEQIDEVLLEFDPILRDEFPSVRMIIRICSNKTELYNMDYYFSLESEQELNHLYDLSSSKFIKIIYPSSDNSVCCKYALNTLEVDTINKTLHEINS